MKLSVYSKSTLRESPHVKQVTDALCECGGFEVVFCDEISKDLDADAVLVFGGDGTMLYAATHTSLPLLGVNLGNVGFLTQVEADAPIELIKKTLLDADVSDRFLIDVAYEKSNGVALNDVVLKSNTSRPLRMTLRIDGVYVDKYHADGVIISTPTGSTAYSLSAGGPVLAPDVDAIIINPICPHSLHSRALIVPSTAKIEFTLDEQAVVVVDGNEIGRTDGTVAIGKSKNTAKFFKVQTDFYKKLLSKMNRWGVTD